MKVFRKILTLFLLIGGLMFILDQSTLTARASKEGACSYWDFGSQLNSFLACDDSLSQTVYNFNSRENDCHNEADMNCSGDPSGSPAYTACYNSRKTSCLNGRVNSWNSRHPDYGSCITGMTGQFFNPDYCEHAFDPCPEAAARVNECQTMFPGDDSEESAARRACIRAVPYVLPVRGTNVCLGLYGGE